MSTRELVPIVVVVALFVLIGILIAVRNRRGG